MTKKVDARGLDRGTTGNQVSAKSFAAGFSPTNYTASQVDSEGTDKVSAHLKGINTKFGLLAGASFINELFSGDGVEDTLTILEPFTETTSIDVFYNGVLKEEDSDWQRDPETNTIQYLNDSGNVAAFPNNSRIRVRLYNNNPFIDQYFAGGVASVTLSNAFNNASKIDVYVNGVLKEEGNDWTRNAGSSLINFVGGTHGDSNTRILARLWN